MARENIEIHIDTSNAAFDDYEYEVARILRKLADDFENDNVSSYLKDINGNVVGNIEIY